MQQISIGHLRHFLLEHFCLWTALFSRVPRCAWVHVACIHLQVLGSTYKAPPLSTSPAEHWQIAWWLASVVQYRQQTRFVRVMFSQVFVCPQGKRGFCIWRGLHPGGAGLHPGASASRVRLGRPPPPPSDTLGQGQRAGGMHPTGMHTCLIILVVRGRFHCRDPHLSSLPPAKVVAGTYCIGFIYIYRSGTLNSNAVNSKCHLIRSFFEIFARFLSFHV